MLHAKTHYKIYKWACSIAMLNQHLFHPFSMAMFNSCVSHYQTKSRRLQIMWLHGGSDSHHLTRLRLRCWRLQRASRRSQRNFNTQWEVIVNNQLVTNISTFHHIPMIVPIIFQWPFQEPIDWRYLP